MADTKISGLTAATSAGSTDEIPFNDSGTTKKITMGNLTTSILSIAGISASAAELNILDGATVTTAELNVLDGIPGTLTATELGYVDGVTSAIQTQINTKQAILTGAATSVVSDDLTASRVLVSDANGKIAASADITTTELGLLNGLSGTIWTSTNDGSGSGLDADTLDGNEAAAFSIISASDISASGYITYANGLTIQWGSFTSSTPATVTFPVAFANACYAVTLSATNYGSLVGASQWLYEAPSKTGFKCAGTASTTFYIAIGS